MERKYAVDISDRTKALLESSYVIDGRDPTFLMYSFTKDPKVPYWNNIAVSGLNAICVDPNWVDAGLRDTAADLAAWYKRIREHDCVLVEKVADIERAKAEGKVGFILASQSPDAIEDNLGFIEVLYKMGMRIMQLAYQRRNYLGEGTGESSNSGLSRMGYEAVNEMNRVGMLIDVAHANVHTLTDILATTTSPVVNSHSCVRSLCEDVRNVSDELIKETCKNGGVYCLSAYSDFLVEHGGDTGTTLDDWARHMDYLINLVGADHVGIGFDVGEGRNAAEVQILHDGVPGIGNGPAHRYVTELVCRAQYPLVVERLVSMGLSDEDIRKIVGGNLHRLFGQVWK